MWPFKKKEVELTQKEIAKIEEGIAKENKRIGDEKESQCILFYKINILHEKGKVSDEAFNICKSIVREEFPYAEYKGVVIKVFGIRLENNDNIQLYMQEVVTKEVVSRTGIHELEMVEENDILSSWKDISEVRLSTYESFEASQNELCYLRHPSPF